MGRILTGATAILSAAHRSPEGRLHGHTWQIRAWWIFDGTDALDRQRALEELIATIDHTLLRGELHWSEELARWIGERLECLEVEVDRPLERLHARWVA